MSAEHASAVIPKHLHQAFSGAEDLLGSHWAWDHGTGVLAQQLASACGTVARCAEVSRLVVDCNRSVGHPKLFSRWLKGCDEATKQELLHRYYRPFRESLRMDVERALERSPRVLHLSVHSFTEILAGQHRDADIGLLYNPGRSGERILCAKWCAQLIALGRYRVRRNYPYRGTSDGHVTALRQSYPASIYLGVEIEINQRILARPPTTWSALATDLLSTLPAANSA